MPTPDLVMSLVGWFTPDAAVLTGAVLVGLGLDDCSPLNSRRCCRNADG